jgi:hypothetical protein
MPTKSTTTYGSYSTIYINVTTSRLESGALELGLAVITLGKQPTMVGESTSMSFNPVPTLVPLSAKSSAWTIDKLGGDVDPEGVEDGGNQYCHGTWKGVVGNTASGSFAVESLDAINVNPITSKFPIGNPLPASYLEADAHAGTGLNRLKRGSVTGMSFNLHNNLWVRFCPFASPSTLSSLHFPVSTVHAQHTHFTRVLHSRWLLLINHIDCSLLMTSMSRRTVGPTAAFRTQTMIFSGQYSTLNTAPHRTTARQPTHCGDSRSRSGNSIDIGGGACASVL